MTTSLPNPKIFHITHLANLPKIIASGALWSDARVRTASAAPANVGLNNIKDRRLRTPVRVGARGMVGDYVPFYFCPRSVMLFLIHKGHENYSGGQNPIVHLVSDVNTAVALGQPWAFTDRNAATAYAQHFDSLLDLDKIDWTAMPKKVWNDPVVKEPRQSEFLVHDSFDWNAVHEIAVIDSVQQKYCLAALEAARHKPDVTVHREWYY
jgi:hypothetical protein